MKQHHRQKLILPFPVVKTAEIIGAQTAIEVLEGIRDKTTAEEWANPIAKHYVLFGIKLCIQVLRKQDIDEIT